MEIFRFDPRAGKSEHLGGMPGGEVYSMLDRAGQALPVLLRRRGDEPLRSRQAVLEVRHRRGLQPDHLRRDGRRAPAPAGDDSRPGRADLHRQRAALRPARRRSGVWDPEQNKTIENYRNLVTNQSIVSLAWEPKSGLIFGGSGNWGGGGTRPTEKEAKFFAFDPKQKRKVFEAALAPGAGSYPATVAADGKVFTTVGDRLFTFDPQTMQVVRTNNLPGPQTQIAWAGIGAGCWWG